MLLLILLIAGNAWAQTSSLLMGSRAMAMGNASGCLQDEWSLLNNPAGLSEVKNSVAAFAYHAYPSFKAFNRMAMVYNQPFKFGTAGLAVYRFGDDLYNEQLLSAGFANTFGLASLGVRFNYIQYHAEGFGTTSAFTVSMGGIAKLTPQLMIGAHITNINQPEISGGDEGEHVPTRLAASLAFKPSDKVILCAELEKDLEHQTLWKTGLEYQFSKKFAFRTGVNVNPDAGFIGIGCKPKKFGLDYALHYNPGIGLTHQASVVYKFSAK